MSAKLPTIIDNRGGNTVQAALARLLSQTKKLDVATGTFEIGSLLALDGQWQIPEAFRIVMGDETTARTKREILAAMRKDSDKSLEEAKERDDQLTGLEAVRDALAKKAIAVRAYSKAKFHAKCYLMDVGDASPVDFAIVGSSNFTQSGLTQNLELNLLTADQFHVDHLRAWYAEVWKEAEEVNEELLKVIEPHLAEYPPFTVYAKALHDYFAGREQPEDAWEAKESVIYRLLSQYQRDGYHRALQMGKEWGGSLICDGVGLGKTFIGLMILERALRDKKDVLLIVPKSAEQSVWQSNIDRYLKPKYRRLIHDRRLEIRRHTDFGRDGTISADDLEHYKEEKQVVLIDEAHHFRNPKSNRGELLAQIAGGKELFLLTATPINNSLDDLYHLINYFARGREDRFASIRINNLRKHFLENEKRIAGKAPATDIAEAAESEDFLRTDELLKHILIQRSRKYVQDSELLSGGGASFPQRQKPRVIEYSLRSVYETLYGELKDAFDKENPFLSLAIYNTAAYAKDAEKTVIQRQKQVIGLIRTLFLKRLESSFKAFEASAEDLLAKSAGFLKRHEPGLFEAWATTNSRWWGVTQDHIRDRLEQEEADAEEEDAIPAAFAEISEVDLDMERLLEDVREDMNILTGFLAKIYRRFYHAKKEGEAEDPTKDDKLQKLLERLQGDPLLKGRKVIVFSEFRTTARYLYRQLRESGLERVEQVDSGRNVPNREKIIQRFAPRYNCPAGSPELADALANPIDILISTDVLSEGLNLQDASLIVNYDLHWNPVRLMQRIGRVDRRLNPDIEKALDRPADLRGKVYFWNFLPPRELEDLLHLKRKLDGKILRINTALGIEGALLTPDDPESSLIEFNTRYEGTESTEELMNLERQRIMEERPDFWAKLESHPRRLFSGKAAGSGFEPMKNRKGETLATLQPNLKPGVFCCYRMPPVIGQRPKDMLDMKVEDHDPDKHPPGEVRWYFRESEGGKIHEGPEQVWTAIRCKEATPRAVEKGPAKLAEARKAIEKHIRATYMRDAQSPIGAKPVLLAWMEIGKP